MASDAPLSPPPNPAVPATGAPRWMRWLLIASLAINLLILGLVAGDAVHDGPRGRHPRAGDLALGPVASALGPADKIAILRDLRGRAGLDAFGPRAREESFAAVAATLRAEPFEPGAFESALEDQLARVRQAEAAVRGAVVAHVAAMSPDDRAAFADRIEAAARRGPGRD